MLNLRRTTHRKGQDDEPEQEAAGKSMFWHLLLLKYKQWRLQHLFMFFVLLLYSVVGAICFVAFEQQNEYNQRNRLRTEMLVRSSLAKKEFIKKFRKEFKISMEKAANFSRNMRYALVLYDQQMGLLTEDEKPIKWTVWGGLYYAGTIVTTIGYGDIATETIFGRIFTMCYAIVGIPLVVIVLSDWGNLLFDCLQLLWFRGLSGCRNWMSKKSDVKTDKPKQISQVNIQRNAYENRVPLKLALALLIFWILLCASVFCLFEEWTFFEAVYFFVVSLTTIGFGDLAPDHAVAVGNFLLILIGLSVVSMSINVIQIQIEDLFGRVILSIESDFKRRIIEEAVTGKEKLPPEVKEMLNGEMKPTVRPETDRSKTTIPVEPRKAKHVDVVEEFEKNVSTAEKMLLKLMSRHQKRMLNKKKEERARLRNAGTQTWITCNTSCVQTDEIMKLPELHRLTPPEVERSETASPNKLYIYNTGE